MTPLVDISLSFVIDYAQQLNSWFTMVMDSGSATNAFLKDNCPGGQQARVKPSAYRQRNYRLFSSRVHQWRPSCRSRGMSWRMWRNFFKLFIKIPRHPPFRIFSHRVNL